MTVEQSIANNATVRPLLGRLRKLCIALIAARPQQSTREGAAPEVPAVAEEVAPRPNVTELPAYRLPLPPHPIAAEQARVLVRLALAHWSIRDIIDNALIIAAELVANAVKMGDVFRITVSRQGGTVLIEVWDPSEAAPDRRRRSIDRVDGRGLLLVDACSKDWGWRLEETGGKTVWAVAGGNDEPAIVPHPARRM
jgi:hypothetical protein